MSISSNGRERSAEMRPARSASSPATGQPVGRRSQSQTGMCEPLQTSSTDTNVMVSAPSAAGALTAASASRITIGEEMVYAAQTLPELRARSVFAFGLRESTELHKEIAWLLRDLRTRCGPVTAAMRLPCRPPFGIARPCYTSALLLIVFNTVQGAESAVRCGCEHTLLYGSDSPQAASSHVVSIQPARQFALSSAEAEACLRLLVISPSAALLQGRGHEEEVNEVYSGATGNAATMKGTASIHAGRSGLWAGAGTQADTLSCSAHRLAALYSASARLWTLVLSPMAVQTVDWRAALAATARDDAYIVDEPRAAALYLVTAVEDERAMRRRRQRQRRRERPQYTNNSTSYTTSGTAERLRQSSGAEDGRCGTATYGTTTLTAPSGRSSAGDGNTSTHTGLSSCTTYRSYNNTTTNSSSSARRTHYAGAGLPAEAESAQARYYRERYGIGDTLSNGMNTNRSSDQEVCDDYTGHAGQTRGGGYWPWAARGQRANSEGNVVLRMLRKGLRPLQESFQQREDPLRFGEANEETTYSGNIRGAFPANNIAGRYNNNNNNEYTGAGYCNGAPALRRRRLEGNAENNGSNVQTVIRTRARDDDTLMMCSNGGPHFPRLGALGSRLAWLPGFHYLLPLFARTPNEEKDSSSNNSNDAAAAKDATTTTTASGRGGYAEKADDRQPQPAAETRNTHLNVRQVRRGCEGLTESALSLHFPRREAIAAAAPPSLSTTSTGEARVPCEAEPAEPPLQLLRGGVHYLAQAQPLRGLKRPYRDEEGAEDEDVWAARGRAGQGDAKCQAEPRATLSLTQRLRRTASRYLPFTVSLTTNDACDSSSSRTDTARSHPPPRADMSTSARTAYTSEQPHAAGQTLPATDAEHEVSLHKRPFFTPLPPAHSSHTAATTNTLHHVPSARPPRPSTRHDVVGDVHSSHTQSNMTNASSTIRVLSVQTPGGDRMSDAHFRSSRGVSDASNATTHTFSASDAPTSSALSTSRGSGTRRQRRGDRNVRFAVPQSQR